MFSLFSSRPPLTTRQRAELELLMRRCIGRLDADVVRKATVVGQLSDLAIDPTSAASLLESTSNEVRRLMRQADVDVQLMAANDSQSSACYQFGTAEISLSSDTLTDPLRLVTSLALAHGQHILQTNAQDGQEDDSRLSELVALCHGFGVLQSDASLYFSTWSQGEWGGWEASKQGHLNAQEIGYALALLARFRGESNPRWKRWLRADSKVTMKQALRHFRRHQASDSPLLFDADRIPGVDSTSRELALWLTGDDPTFALASAWHLCSLERFDLPITEALHVATQSDDLELAAIAITLLAGADQRDQATIDRIQSLLRDRRPAVALAATKAADGFGLDLGDHVGTLAWLLEKLPHQRLDILPLITAQGRAASHLDSIVCRLLIRSLKSVDDPLSEALVDCLIAISDSPRKLIKKTISAGPIRDEAIAWLDRGSQPRSGDRG